MFFAVLILDFDCHPLLEELYFGFADIEEYDGFDADWDHDEPPLGYFMLLLLYDDAEEYVGFPLLHPVLSVGSTLIL